MAGGGVQHFERLAGLPVLLVHRKQVAITHQQLGRPSDRRLIGLDGLVGFSGLRTGQSQPRKHLPGGARRSGRLGQKIDRFISLFALQKAAGQLQNQDFVAGIVRGGFEIMLQRRAVVVVQLGADARAKMRDGPDAVFQRLLAGFAAGFRRFLPDGAFTGTAGALFHTRPGRATGQQRSDQQHADGPRVKTTIHRVQKRSRYKSAVPPRRDCS